MKRKNAVPPLICALLMSALSVITAIVCSDITASLTMGIFIAAVVAEAIERIRHNLKVRQIHKDYKTLCSDFFRDKSA